jgi:hypothetical protein
MNLLKGCKITVVEAAAGAGQAELVTDVLDMSGYEGVIFIALLGDVLSTSVLTLTVKGNSANSVSSPSPVTQKASVAFTADATNADSKAIVVDVYRPTLRYVFGSFTRTVANATVGGIIAIQYDARNKPTTQDASVIASAFSLGVSS